MLGSFEQASCRGRQTLKFGFLPLPARFLPLFLGHCAICLEAVFEAVFECEAVVAPYCPDNFLRRFEGQEC